MPPEQCPECGRFLSRAFVTSLDVAAAPCPKCDHLLDTEQLGHGAEPDQAPTSDEGLLTETADDPAPPPPPVVKAPEVAPTLAGWDDNATLAPHSNTAPPDAAIVAGAGAFGAVLGLLFSGRRGRGGVIGALIGVMAAAVARRVWELDDQG